MSPVALLQAAEARLAEADPATEGFRPWWFGVRRLAERFGWTIPAAAAVVLLLDWSFARVEADPAQPRRFRLAEAGGVQALLVPVCGGGLTEGWFATDRADDVLALSLEPGSAWFRRLTLAAAWISAGRPVEGDVLQLREGVHAYVAEAALAVRRRRDPDWRHPAPGPAGLLVLDPATIDWTRRGALAGVEEVRLLDARADGPLGTALRRLNPKLGRKGGVPVAGLAPRRRAA